MAQMTCFGPSRSFDIHWEPRIELAARVLAKIQDSWVITGGGFPSERAAAVVLYLRLVSRLAIPSARFGKARPGIGSDLGTPVRPFHVSRNSHSAISSLAIY